MGSSNACRAGTAGARVERGKPHVSPRGHDGHLALLPPRETPAGGGNRMESLLWPRRERLRPTVRRARSTGRGAGPTADHRVRLRVAAAGVAALTVVLGIAGMAVRPDPAGSAPAAPALPALAPGIAGRAGPSRRAGGRAAWGPARAPGPVRPP